MVGDLKYVDVNIMDSCCVGGSVLWDFPSRLGELVVSHLELSESFDSLQIVV